MTRKHIFIRGLVASQCIIIPYLPDVDTRENTDSTYIYHKTTNNYFSFPCKSSCLINKFFSYTKLLLYNDLFSFSYYLIFFVLSFFLKFFEKGNK